MPKLAANLSMLFREHPFLDRFAAAADAGFEAVEYQFPYDEGSPEDIAARAKAAGVKIVLHNMPRGDSARGELGTACIPGREDRFREDLEKGIRYAVAAGCTRLHCMAGLTPAGVEPGLVHRTYVSNLRHAAGRLAQEALQLLIEPLSAGTAAGTFLTGSAQAIHVLDEVGAPNAWLQYDLFHMQALEGNLAETIRRLLPRIGHLQIADLPGRHEPGTGEINYAFLLPYIDRLGYEGWIGCEYNPAGETVEGLTWARPYLRAR